ncbi:MAG TPA: Hsp20/alpha crystallin family protein [Gammaproteobacteria bacterium]|nr:Hsp20/alpha crystallin family protein [Gammaproteobacteria bacterium]
MMNIARYSPLSTTSPLDDVFDNFFQGFLRPVRWEGGQQAAANPIKLDVMDNQNAYLVHAEIPGVKKEDIQVTIDGNQLAISAEINQQYEEKDKNKILRTERYYGKMFRSIVLPQDVDEGGAKAKYNAGVLELTLPKKETSTAKKLTVQ